jgi:hypothetical protein
VREMIQINGLPQTVADTSTIDLNSKTNTLKVQSTHTVGLFFARIVNVNSIDVHANRGVVDPDDSTSMGIAPLAIPHGLTRDSLTEYSCEIFQEGEGFIPDKQYIIKLGECIEDDTVSIPQDEDYKMILIPMDSTQVHTTRNSRGQTTYDYDAVLRAYGAAFWCLHTGEEDDESYTPVQWVLGYRGGSFLLPYSQNIINMLESNQYRVKYEIANITLLRAIYDAVNDKTYKILELYDRPLVGVYSSQTGVDPVELILQTACIPYGPYCLPSTTNFFKRGTFQKTRCEAFYDADIMAGKLDAYNWLHLHHEDFTGCNEGCLKYNNNCYNTFSNAAPSSGFSTKTQAQTALNNYKTNYGKYLCSICRNALNNATVTAYQERSGITYGSYVTRYQFSWSSNNCGFARKSRCADRIGVDGGRWINLSSALCSTCNATDLYQVAANHGYTNDSNVPAKYFNLGGGISPNDYNTWFGPGNATAIQKMRFAMVDIIREHVINGGFLFAQCFAPETLDLALWQKAIYEGKTGNAAFEYCFAFQNITYDLYPCTYPYSNINVHNVYAPFSMMREYDLEPECQLSTTVAQTSMGKTSAFRHSTIKSGIKIFGDYSRNSYCKYLGGDLGKGKFSFLGGHNHTDTASKRLVLNNVLLGSLAEKAIVGKTSAKENKIKYNYGRIDPDNVRNDYNNAEENAQAVDDYINRIKFGFNQTINLNDRLITESGNLSASTEEAIEYASGAIIIVPITDIGDEAGEHSTVNANTTIYDLKDTDSINLGGLYVKNEDYSGLTVPIRVVGFAKFQIIHPSCYGDYESGDGSDLGGYLAGQIRARFIEYIVHPSEVQDAIN